MFLLKIAEGYDRRNNNPEEPIHNLLTQFENISCEAEAHEAREAQVFERMGTYAEAIVAVGKKKADLSFPDVAAHVKICPDCRSAIQSTVASLKESKKSK